MKSLVMELTRVWKAVNSILSFSLSCNQLLLCFWNIVKHMNVLASKACWLTLVDARCELHRRRPQNSCTNRTWNFEHKLSKLKIQSGSKIGCHSPRSTNKLRFFSSFEPGALVLLEQLEGTVGSGTGRNPLDQLRPGVHWKINDW